MSNAIEILKIYPETFRANVYSHHPFRMIGLIDASIRYTYGVERVTLAYFRSSGTNSGKIKGLWYPIAGIKMYSGGFTEFSRYINRVLSITTRNGRANEGWLAKSLFFVGQSEEDSRIRGFSNGMHQESLYNIGKELRDLYENDNYTMMLTLEPAYLNSMLVSKQIYQGNKHTQRENFEKFIQDIFEGE